MIALLCVLMRMTAIGIGIGTKFGKGGGTPPAGGGPVLNEWITPFIWMNDYV